MDPTLIAVGLCFASLLSWLTGFAMGVAVTRMSVEKRGQEMTRCATVAVAQATADRLRGSR